MTSRQSAVRTALLACLAVSAVAACSGSDGVASPGEGVFVTSPPPAPPSPPTSPPPPPPPSVVAAASCPTGFNDAGTITVPGGALRNCQLPAAINSTLSLQNASGVIYSVSGRVDVGVDLGADPAAPLAGGVRGVLNVAPGVTVFGSGGTDYLVVNRGSAINAAGTVDQPIIFTSRQGVQGATNIDSIGQWGGLVILGRAPTSVCPTGTVPPAIACTAQVEGTSAFYGGLTRTDNSGQLRFVRVQHSGFELLPNNELNGITLAGVGSNTIVENIQVHNSSDDGIEIFGGTVNLRNIVLTGNDDDSYDVDTGWRGATINLLAVQRPAGGDRVFEFSSAGVRSPVGSPATGFTLNTEPRISGATLVKRSSSSDAIILNTGNGLKLWNTVVTSLGGSGSCLRIDDADTQTAATTFNSVFLSCATSFSNDTNVDAAATGAIFNAGTNNTAAGTSTLAARTGGGTSPSTVLFVNGANETAVARTAPVNVPAADSGLAAANAYFGATPAAPAFIGAVAPASTWYQGWTCSPLIGEEAC
jgi:hypothetical protein